MNYRAVLWLAVLLFLIPASFPLLADSAVYRDTLRVLALRVEFQPDNSAATTGDGTFDLGTSSNPFQIDPPPHNRGYFQDHLRFLRNYFLKVSRGSLQIEGEVFPRAAQQAYRLDQPMTFYNPNTTPGEINVGLARLLRDALEKADADPDIDFSRYDSFIIFHAGVGRDIDLGLDNTPQDIPSLFITRAFLQQHLGVDGISVDDGNTVVHNGIILPETESQEGIQLGLNGMIVSNMGSQLGWLDLFSPTTRKSGVGRFGVMDAGLFNGDGLLPALPSAWTRIEAGFETAATIYQAQGDQFTVASTLSAQQPHIYKVPINQREYFLIENRNAGTVSLDSLQFVMSSGRTELATMREVLATHFPAEAQFSDSTGVLIDIDNPDRGLPGGGILIWHIDENIIDAGRAQNAINADPDHRGVDLEEADGSQDIGQVFDFISGGAGSEIGTPLDPWYADNSAPLFQADPRNEFSLTSVPNSRSNTNRANSHVRLFDFSRRDTLMTFKADINFFQANFPRHIDAQRYGRVTSLKTADLDGDGAGELLFSTDRQQLLVMDRSGRSPWNSGDTLQILSAPPQETLLAPPAVFALDDGRQALAVLTREGSALGFTFNTATQQLDSLFRFQCPAAITTFPVVENLPANRTVPVVFWGCADGNVYQVDFSTGTPAFSVFASVGEPIRYLQFANPQSGVIVTVSGAVFENEQRIGQVPADVSQPVGSGAVALSRDGRVFELREGRFEHPEDEIHRFDAAAAEVMLPDAFSGLSQSHYLTAGDNRLLHFNYNFTLRDNFPVPLYRPEQPTDLRLTPLVGNGFFDARGEETVGIVVTDPAGMIAGYDLSGRLLPDFPLAVGDSLDTSPAMVDVDGDGDLELAAVTRGGVVYLWDFSSSYAAIQPWGQLYGTAQNQNRQVIFEIGPGSQPQELLPAKSVYNWPNPNIDNYTFIRYRLNQAADVRIKIFDLAGDLVRELPGSGAALTDNEVRWDLNGVQSGVYLCRVEARGQERNEVKVIKIAVVK